MMACVDVDYREGEGAAACVLFTAWADEHPAAEHVERVRGVAEYVPGQFYRRELPCLLAVLAGVGGPVGLVVVDGYVWLEDEAHPGLGARLYEALGGRTPVVGVAKTRYAGAGRAVAVRRGESATRPLWVTAAGMEVEAAAGCVAAMHGPYRIPTLLRRVDQLCRSARFGADPG
jgi:deoxyribonuclease V